MKKEIEVNGKKLTVELKKGKYLWQVLVGGSLWMETANELFAVCEFNAI